MGGVGLGCCHAAVSILNAIPTGVGAAVGVDLKVSCRLELTREGEVHGLSKVRGREVPIPARILRGFLGVLKESFGYKGGIRVYVESEAPIGVGLKASSALINSMLLGAAEALELKLSRMDIARLGVEAARRSGTTITGALDDHMATLYNGVYVTDNYRGEILTRYSIGCLPIVIYVPPRQNPIEGVSVEPFQRLSRYYSLAVRLALERRWTEALTLNGILTGVALGSGADLAFEALTRPGTIAAGVTGKGPAVVAVTREPENVAGLWDNLGGEVIITRILGGDGEG